MWSFPEKNMERLHGSYGIEFSVKLDKIRNMYIAYVVLIKYHKQKSKKSTVYSLKV